MHMSTEKRQKYCTSSKTASCKEKDLKDLFFSSKPGECIYRRMHKSVPNLHSILQARTYCSTGAINLNSLVKFIRYIVST